MKFLLCLFTSLFGSFNTWLVTTHIQQGIWGTGLFLIMFLVQQKQ